MKDEAELRNLADGLRDNSVAHKLWVEQPENSGQSINIKGGENKMERKKKHLDDLFLHPDLQRPFASPPVSASTFFNHANL